MKSNEIPSCPLCSRGIEDPRFLSDHHLIPKSRGGKVTRTICLDCHNQIHALFSNKQLENLNSVELLLADLKLAKFIIWVSKKPFGGIKARRAKESRKRGRSG